MSLFPLHIEQLYFLGLAAPNGIIADLLISSLAIFLKRNIPFFCRTFFSYFIKIQLNKIKLYLKA